MNTGAADRAYTSAMITPLAVGMEIVKKYRRIKAFISERVIYSDDSSPAFWYEEREEDDGGLKSSMGTLNPEVGGKYDLLRHLKNSLCTQGVPSSALNIET